MYIICTRVCMLERASLLHVCRLPKHIHRHVETNEIWCFRMESFAVVRSLGPIAGAQWRCHNLAVKATQRDLGEYFRCATAQSMQLWVERRAKRCSPGILNAIAELRDNDFIFSSLFGICIPGDACSRSGWVPKKSWQRDARMLIQFVFTPLKNRRASCCYY